MAVIDVALKDIRQILGDRKVALMLVLMPITFTAFFGILFSNSGDSANTPPPVGWVDQDMASSPSLLLQLLKASNSLQIVYLDQCQAQSAADQVQEGKLAAVISVPTGFQSGMWHSAGPQLEVMLDQGTTAGLAVREAVDAALVRLLGAVRTAQLSAEAYEQQRSFPDSDARQAYLDEALALALGKWFDATSTITTEQAGVTRAGSSEAENAFNRASPGMMIQFSIWGLIMSANVVVAERKNRAMLRLLTTPVQRWQIVVGHSLGMFLITLGLELLLIAFGQFAANVEYLRAPLATFSVAVALALWVVSLGMLIGALCRDDGQVTVLSLMAMFVFTGLGGAWFPLDATAPAFAALGRLMPTYWAMRGFQDILLRGHGLAAVLPSAAIVAAYAIPFYVLAVRRFRFE